MVEAFYNMIGHETIYIGSRGRASAKDNYGVPIHGGETLYLNARPTSISIFAKSKKETIGIIISQQ